MTTAQIIILSLLFIGDFHISIITPVFKFDNPIYATIQCIRMCVIWALLVCFIILCNRNIEKVQGKCPEYQKIEVYQLKQ